MAVAVLGSLTVLPAVLATLGGHLDRPRVPVLWRLSASDPAREPRLWSQVLRPTLAHPARTLTASTLLLLVLAAPALGLTLHSDSPQSLPASIPAVGTLNRLTAAFPQQNSTDVVVVSAPTDRGAAVVAGAAGAAEPGGRAAVRGRAADDPDVAGLARCTSWP